MAYYERPEMVKLALDSICAQGDADYHLAIVDDGSTKPLRDVIDQYVWTIGDVTLYNTNDSVEQKLAQGGSRFGSFWNKAIEDTDADLGIMLCDDDALVPGYINGLDRYYTANQDVKYSYGHVSVYDPTTYPSIDNMPFDYGTFLNAHTWPIDPYCRVDASQVSWRIKDWKEAGIKFPAPQTAALDAEVYSQMFEAFGPCPFNEMVVQYKGVFSDQLGQRSNHFVVIDDGPTDTELV
jgi:glycosyltransferase involved in cell wall biosynthesis